MKTSSTIRAFNLCFLLAIGLAFWTSAARAQTPINCGQTIASNTVANSENDQYTFAGTVGQELVFALYGPLNCNSPYQTMSADIYSPSGHLLATVTSGNCNTGAAISMTLTNSGTYTILVHAAAYNASGGYQLSIQSVIDGGCDPTPIACGQNISGSTSFNSQMNTYSYVGSAGQELLFALYGPLNCNSPYQTMSADIYNPSGQYLATVTSGNCNTGAAISMTLTNSGTYTILVHAASYNRAGGYQLSIQSVFDGGCDPTPIACGQNISGSTSFNSQMNTYSYVGSAGQELVFALYGPLNCNSPYQSMSANIYSPSGQYLATLTSGNCNTGGSLSMTLTNSGTYTILVYCTAFNAAGGYQLSIQSVIDGGCDPTPIACGQNISGSTSFNSQMNTYSYAGFAGQELVFALYGPRNCNSPYQSMSANIYSPSGQYLATLTSGNCNTGAALSMTLTNSGTYTILVYCTAFNAAGGYQLSIQSIIDGGCDSSPITCGQTVSSATTNNAEVDAYSIDGCSNDVVILSTSGFSGSEFDLHDPTGKLVFSIGPGTSSNVTFSVSGVYTLLVHSSSYNGTGSYGVTLTCLIACTYTTGTVSAQPNGGWTTGGGTIRCCFPVQVCAIPDGCYNFVSWTDPNSNVVSTLPCYTFFATNSETLTAHFAPTAGVTNQICNAQVVGTNVLISAQSVDGDNYQLQSRNSLTTGSWANVTGVSLSNSPGGLIILTNFGGASVPQKFFRLDVTP